MLLLVRAVSIAFGVVLVAGACRSASATGTTAAYYTASQAAAGAKLYGARCSACHGVKLQGVSAPALRASAYATASSVAEVYRFMVETMPMGKPGTLTPAQYAAVMAYLLRENGFRAGATPLTGAVAKRMTARY
ncbi:MAG: cytochrome c, class [Candidatus Eremiobacteraeota bacterium]|nr:cytochrome c, class [Candidatus Eremiobacteraeota bacterium]